MKAVIVFSLLCAVGVIESCSLNPGVQVEANVLFGTWYEKQSLGDGIKAIFSKCIVNQIYKSSNGDNSILKSRSYKWKWFPFITWTDNSSLNNKGVSWMLITSSLFGTSSNKLQIIAQDPNYLILKMCPNEWFADERIWIYSKSKDSFSAAQKTSIEKALTDAGEPGLADFRTVSQDC